MSSCRRLTSSVATAAFRRSPSTSCRSSSSPHQVRSCTGWNPPRRSGLEFVAISLTGPNAGQVVARQPVADPSLYLELPLGTFGNTADGVVDRVRQPGAVMIGHVDAAGMPATVDAGPLWQIDADDVVSDGTRQWTLAIERHPDWRRSSPASPLLRRRRTAPVSTGPTLGRRSKATSSPRRCRSSPCSTPTAPGRGTPCRPAGRSSPATSAARCSPAGSGTRSSWPDSTKRSPTRVSATSTRTTSSTRCGCATPARR